MDDMGTDGTEGGGDDMGMDLESMGIGTDGQNSDIIGSFDGVNRKSLANLQLQTLFALQELGIVIGVAFMVGLIFLLMITIEKVWSEVFQQYRKRFGKEDNTADIEADPASLVGTFKRYKN